MVRAVLDASELPLRSCRHRFSFDPLRRWYRHTGRLCDLAGVVMFSSRWSHYCDRAGIVAATAIVQELLGSVVWLSFEPLLRSCRHWSRHCDRAGISIIGGGSLHPLLRSCSHWGRHCDLAGVVNFSCHWSHYCDLAGTVVATAIVRALLCAVISVSFEPPLRSLRLWNRYCDCAGIVCRIVVGAVTAIV